MKELKLRAWDQVTEKMYYSTLEQMDDALVFRFQHFEDGDPNPLYMEYTGKTATDGTEIYEGDILKVEERNLDNAFGGFGEPYETKIVRVRWIEASASFYVPGGFVKSIEVIGNVFEHPHLLKEDK